ncbi:MAG: hypothetical protein KF911_09195 [Pseudomonadales bacterium]|nr:hypothetical protein [Pseudomonadales bacterium]
MSVPVIRLLVLAMLASAEGVAHEMTLDLHVLEGTQVAGTLAYSDGSAAGGSYLEVQDLTDARMSPITVETREDGSFRVAGVRGHRYAFTVHGDEGHAMTVEVALEPSGTGGAGPNDTRNGWPPVYIVIGSLLLLSLLPARLLRVR